ncbi:MAG: dephospho-CoA kinase [Eubacteriaceae bacterium]|nr:dephospho-CoA kinase [Eubacteriaceae bacterium]
MAFIGITGGIGTGKSTVSSIIRQKYSFPIIDADELSRAASKSIEAKEGIRAAFGSIAFDGDDVDRKALADIVFSNEESRKTLESIIHPIVARQAAEMKAELEAEGNKIIFYDVPLLFEAGLEGDVDKTILVYSSNDIAAQRLVDYRGMDIADATRRIKSQMDIDEKASKADIIVYNDSSIADLEGIVVFAIDMLIQEYGA